MDGMSPAANQLVVPPMTDAVDARIDRGESRCNFGALRVSCARPFAEGSMHYYLRGRIHLQKRGDTCGLCEPCDGETTRAPSGLSAICTRDVT